MKIYAVGGAVRDKFLNREIHDLDFVVVGATPEEMIDKGFTRVGADFPVFLDPVKGYEHALARTERKVGGGYKGFETFYDPDVTLEEDLRRRDLTINAMAQDMETGEIIDPFGGQQDIADRKLRHVSEAFAEDPVRVLRTARFSAQLGDFTIDRETIKLMKQMVENGEVDNLTRERVIAEVTKAMAAPCPDGFFKCLSWIDALHSLFPGRVANLMEKNWQMLDPTMYAAHEPLLTVSQRWMELLRLINSNGVRDLKRFGFSNDVVRVAEITSVLSNDPNLWEPYASSRKRLNQVLKRFGFYKDQTLLGQYLELYRMSRDCVNEELEAIAEIGKIGFDDLTEEQQGNLSGPQIGQAIDDLRTAALDRLPA